MSTYEMVRPVSDDLDLTRYVRTPAGVKFYHKPIGSPIGGGTASKVEKVAKTVTDSRGVTSVQLVDKHKPTAFYSADPTSVKQAVFGTRPTRTGKSRASAEARRVQMKAVTDKLNPDERRQVAKIVAADTSKADSVMKPEDALALKRELTGEQIRLALGDKNIPKSVKDAVTKDDGSPEDTAKAISKLLALKAERDAFVEQHGSSKTVDGWIHKHFPKTLASGYDRLASRFPPKHGDIDKAQSTADSMIDWGVKAVLTVALGFAGVHMGGV